MEPQTPAILFAIDVSYPMMKEGIVQMICSNMKEMLKNLPRDMYCDKVSFFFVNAFLFSLQSILIELIQRIFNFFDRELVSGSIECEK